MASGSAAYPTDGEVDYEEDLLVDETSDLSDLDKGDGPASLGASERQPQWFADYLAEQAAKDREAAKRDKEKDLVIQKLFTQIAELKSGKVSHGARGP